MALFGNIAPLEVLVILALAVVIFGSRLPEVAAKVYAQFRRMREAMDRFRQETGIDREMHEIERNVRAAAWRKELESRNLPPAPGSVGRGDVGMAREEPGPAAEPSAPPASAEVKDAGESAGS